MRRALALLSVAVLALTGCGQSETMARLSPITARTPSVTPTPKPSPKPTSTKPSAPVSIDLTGGVLNNKLYAAGKVPVVRCTLPRANLRSKAGMVAYARVLIACMDKAWGPMVQKSDAYLFPPEVFAYSLRTPKATPDCTNAPKNTDAFYYYSGVSGKICFAWDNFLEVKDQTMRQIYFEEVIAHEYGHHVQQSVGILTLYGELLRGKNKTGQLEVERRKELQASCFGAAFLGANKKLFRISGLRLQMWRYIVLHVGDEYSTVRDHGSRKNHSYWSTRAFTSTTPATCNTFTAPATKVS
ncbi:neutral zinc metallopeptidase [Kribbella sp. NPDC054772]